MESDVFLSAWNVNLSPIRLNLASLPAAEKILQRGITRGELPGDVDVQLALDLMAAPLFWRAVVTQGDTSGPYIRTMTSAFLRAIDATPGHSATSAIEREQTPI